MTVLFFKAFAGLLIFDICRLSSNFATLHEMVRNCKTKLGPTSEDTLSAVCDAINYACAWYPKRVLCLQRSAVTACLLRRCGVPAEMVVGAQQLPFKAHAWVEVNNCAINERTDVVQIYQVWDRC